MSNYLLSGREPHLRQDWRIVFKQTLGDVVTALGAFENEKHTEGVILVGRSWLAVPYRHAPAPVIVAVTRRFDRERVLRLGASVNLEEKRVLRQSSVWFLFVDADKAVGFDQNFGRRCVGCRWTPCRELIQNRPRAELHNREVGSLGDGGTERRFHIHDFKLVPKRDGADLCPFFKSGLAELWILGKVAVVGKEFKCFGGKEMNRRFIYATRTFGEESGSFQFLDSFLGGFFSLVEIQGGHVLQRHDARLKESAQQREIALLILD